MHRHSYLQIFFRRLEIASWNNSTNSSQCNISNVKKLILELVLAEELKSVEFRTAEIENILQQLSLKTNAFFCIFQ